MHATTTRRPPLQPSATTQAAWDVSTLRPTITTKRPPLKGHASTWVAWITRRVTTTPKPQRTTVLARGLASLVFALGVSVLRLATTRRLPLSITGHVSLQTTPVRSVRMMVRCRCPTRMATEYATKTKLKVAQVLLPATTTNLWPTTTDRVSFCPALYSVASRMRLATTIQRPTTVMVRASTSRAKVARTRVRATTTRRPPLQASATTQAAWDVQILRLTTTTRRPPLKGHASTWDALHSRLATSTPMRT